MEIITLKYSIMNERIISFKINDIEQEKIKLKQNCMTQYFDEIFDTPKYSSLWKKICSTRVHLYFCYNVTNLNLRLKTYNLINTHINNKTLILNKFFDHEDTSLLIDILDIKPDVEINILIKIIIPPSSKYCKLSKIKWNSNNNFPYLKIFDGYRDDLIILPIIKIIKPNPMFRLVKTDNYDKKISSFKMSLYDISDKKYTKTNFDIIFDLYPTQSICYMLILVKIINTSLNTSLNFVFDKECIKCENRIAGCELNLISKVLLCCDCNQKLMGNSTSKFIDSVFNGNNNCKLYVKINDFPSYIKDNFLQYYYLNFN